MDNQIDYIPADMILEIATRRPTHVNEIKGCREINFSCGGCENPRWTEGNDVEKYLQPHQMMEQLLAEGWVVSNLFYKRNDGVVNFGHEPSVSHNLVAVLVKIK